MNLINKLVIITILLFSTLALAQNKKTKRTVIDFEEDLIQGDRTNPELFYLLERKQFNYKKLIRLRENFLPEMRRTAEEIKRSGR
ncbi:MAG: hypothetical protein MK008_08065 [Bdellovibrionales bacterium]|nr:hypothetical protein [Bdellovibrionales bacterium]